MTMLVSEQRPPGVRDPQAVAVGRKPASRHPSESAVAQNNRADVRLNARASANRRSHCPLQGNPSPVRAGHRGALRERADNTAISAPDTPAAAAVISDHAPAMICVAKSSSEVAVAELSASGGSWQTLVSGRYVFSDNTRRASGPLTGVARRPCMIGCRPHPAPLNVERV